MCYPVGTKLRFAEEKRAYTVQASNERYAVCTKPFNLRGPEAVIYTIVDVERQIRGTENLIFCMGFATRDKCDQALARLSSGESEISHRNWVPLDIAEVFDPPRSCRDGRGG